MKHLFLATSAIAIMASIAPTSTMAQNKAIDELFDKFASSSYITRSTASETVSDSIKPSYHKIFYFSMPQSKKSEVMKFETAFNQGRNGAYFISFQNNNDDDDNYKPLKLTLSDGSKFVVGKDDEYNYRVLCYKDPKDPNYRYCYVLEWSNDDEDDDNGKPLYTGYVARLYSKRPTAEAKTGTKVSNVAPANGNFLQRFGFFRNRIQNISNSSATELSLFCNALYDLCKKEHEKRELSQAERDICVKNLNSLAANVKDGFASDILKQAAVLLSEKR